MAADGGVPFEKPLSEKVSGFYGFKDGRAELRVKLPFIFHPVKKEFHERFTPEQLREVKKLIDEAVRWADMPQEDRDRMGAP